MKDSIYFKNIVQIIRFLRIELKLPKDAVLQLAQQAIDAAYEDQNAA